MQYIMLTLAAALLAVNFALNKVYQKSEGTSPKAGFAFNALLGLCTAVIFFVTNGFKADFSLYSSVMAILMNAFIVAYTILGFKLLRSGSMALYTLFLMTGGMTVPYIWGVLFLDEPFTLLRTAALLLILAGVILPNFSGGKVDAKQILMCIAVFFLNGFVSVVSKLHQIETTFPIVDTTEFVILSGILKFFFAGILYVITKNNREEKTEKLSRPMVFLIIALTALVSGVSSVLQLQGAVSLPATVLYPFITGGSIVFSALTGVIVFKEKISKKLVLSVILCFIGTVMFL